MLLPIDVTDIVGDNSVSSLPKLEGRFRDNGWIVKRLLSFGGQVISLELVDSSVTMTSGKEEERSSVFVLADDLKVVDPFFNLELFSFSFNVLLSSPISSSVSTTLIGASLLSLLFGLSKDLLSSLNLSSPTIKIRKSAFRN